ncbi:15193_t:CDS:2 [Entrophospora sp. SA101]|nr:15193_t:CDS:2 [Entrophospora sp. SA101]CAJ0834110.1 11176_t:CDS:2 [Entrophospora sp. SA101]
MSTSKIEEIYQHINKINEKIPLQQEEMVIIIGDTGEWKSSLLNYLAEVPLFVKKGKGFGRFVIYAENPLGDSEITDGCVSKTSLPSGWKEYWVCPGFGDTRGEVQDIVNAYSIYKLIKSAKKIKVLVTVSETTITGSRSRSFLNLIHNVGETFKNTDEDKLVQGLCLVVTKNETLNLKKMRNGLLEILEEQDDQENFSLTQKKILGSLSSPESQIVFFNAPTGEGLISGEGRSQILEGIKKISYLEKPEPSISIPAESKYLIKNLADKLNNDIENFIKHKFYPGILGKLIDNHSGTVKELRESQSLKYFCDQLNKISNEPQQFENNLCQISSITKLFQRKELEEEFDKKILQLKFIKLIKPESLEIKDNTSMLTSPEKYQQGHKLIFKGLIVGAEDINDAMKGQELSEVNVYSLNSLFIDEDIIAPGVNLTLMSPNWYVVGKRKISLKGKPGTWHQLSKAVDGIDEINGNKELIDQNDENSEPIDENDGNSEPIDERGGEDGLPGLPGLPGKNGGDFYAKGKKFFNLSSLTIDVSGGDGGQGQDGGNGGNGLDETFVSYDPGHKGGSGGQGGEGGFEGKPGFVVIDSPFQLSGTPAISKVESKKGVNGTGGKPGKGGKNVKYCGVYINEMVIPEIRGYNEFAEGSKVAMQEVSKGTLKIVSQEAAEKITKEGGEVVVKNFLKIGATESGKHVVKVGASTGASLIKGMGIGLIFQAVASSLSAYLSSHWEKEVHKVDCGYAPNGKSSNSFNGPEIQKPSKLFINKYKNVCYNDFYAQRKNDHLLPDVCLDLDFISNRIYDDCNIVFTDPSSTSS